MSKKTDDPTPESIAGYVKTHAKRVKSMLSMQHHAIQETVREMDYKGHHIVIGTTYRIEVDGRSLGGHFIVTDDGQVQCHALPNYTFLSAVDTVKTLIDTFPEDFSGAAPPNHGMHDHHSAPTKKKVAKKKSSAKKSQSRKGRR